MPHFLAMRKKSRRTPQDDALRLLETATSVHLASTTADGAVVLRALNAVVHDGMVIFHGAITGEKSGCIGRPGIVSAIEEICDVPSYFTSPEKGCPATAYYRSVQAHGMIRDIAHADAKAAALQALMDKYQAEGRYRPFVPLSSCYEKDLRSVRVFGLEIDRVDGKANLGQDKPVEHVQKVVSGLWQRGKTRDLEAIREIVDLTPAANPPDFFGPMGTRFVVAPRGDELARAAELLAGNYWRVHSSRTDIEIALRASPVWLGALLPSGRLVATARAITDTAWLASIHDVVVHPDFRGRGIGERLVRLLLDHPRVRACKAVRLGTSDGQEFYRRIGFVESSTIKRDFASIAMELVRA